MKLRRVWKRADGEKESRKLLSKGKLKERKQCQTETVTRKLTLKRTIFL